MAHCEATATETIMSSTSSQREICDKKMQVLIDSKRSAFIPTKKYEKIVHHLKITQTFLHKVAVIVRGLVLIRNVVLKETILVVQLIVII